MARKAAWPPVPRPHASGQARVVIEGADYYLGPFGSPEAAAALAALVGRIEGERREASKQKPGVVTVAVAVARWDRDICTQLPEKEARWYRRALSVLLRLHAGTPVDEYDADHLDEVQTAMASGAWITPADRERKGAFASTARRWGLRTVNRAIGRIRTVWRWLERRKVVPKGSWSALRSLPSLKPGDRRAAPMPVRKRWSHADAVAVAVEISRSPARQMLLAQLWTGMRSGEVRRMRWSEIDRLGDVWIYRPAQHKNTWRGQSREVALGPKAVSVLEQARRREPKGDLVFPCRYRGKLTGQCYTPEAYGRVVTEAAKRCGRHGFRAYDCRHIAKQRLTRLYGLDTARAVLGQKSLSTTDRYGDSLDLQTAIDAARKTG